MLTGAVIYAKDLAHLTRFYAALGGAIAEEVAGDYAVIRDGTGEIALLQIPAQIAEHIQITDPPTVRAATPIKLRFQVASIETALSTITGLGGRTEADAKPWSFRGHMIQDAIDPEGNVIQLCQPETAQP